MAHSTLAVLLLHTLHTKCCDIKPSNPYSTKCHIVLKLESNNEEEAEDIIKGIPLIMWVYSSEPRCNYMYS